VSLASLARESGVARATLYQVESGQGNPAIGTLFAIASVLGVTLSDLVEEDGTPQMEVIRASDGISVIGEALEARLLRRFPSNGLALELYDFTVKSNTRTENHEHPTGVFEHVLVNSGRLLAGPVENACMMRPGDYLRFRADLQHVYEAFEEPVRATLLMEYPPVLGLAGGDRATAAAVDPAAPNGAGR